MASSAYDKQSKEYDDWVASGKDPRDFRSSDTTGSSGYAAIPEDISGKFPGVATVDFKGLRAKRPPIRFVDPVEFGRTFGAFNREEITKNYEQAKTIGLDAVETELQALLNYVPQSAQMMREQVAADNFFNQQQRTQQLQQATPELFEDLNTVRANARAYAEGRLPDALQDRALELGIRSDAADMASAGGFGVQSSAARKASDLMSARERLDIAKYGENLLERNMNQRADLLLAPTQYSTAGSQVNINPTISAGAMSQQVLSELNRVSLIDATTAFGTQVDQNKFFTSTVQRTREFNKTMKYNVRTFNANAINNFALSLFNYMAAQAQGVAAAQQVGINTAVAIGQQREAMSIYERERERTQEANERKDILESIGEVLGSVSEIKDLLGL